MTEYMKKIRGFIGNDRLQTVGTSVHIYRDGKLLLQKRRDNGCWAEHGGYVELGEIVEDAARRELLEETGLTAHSLELIGVFSGEQLFYTYPNGDQVANLDIAYLCEDFSGKIAMQEDEVAGLQWFDIDDLPPNISPPSVPGLMKVVEVLRARLCRN